MKKKKKVDLEGLHEYASPSQKRTLDAMIKLGSVRAVAEKLKLPTTRIRNHLSEVKQKAARRGWSPAHDMTSPVAPGFHLTRHSQYYDGEGAPRGKWVISKPDQEHQYTQLLDAMQSAMEPYAGKAKRIKEPTKKTIDKDLLSLYPLGDPHIGMAAWSKQTGQDFNLEIAERNLLHGVDRLVEKAEPAEHALIMNLGDFFHVDSSANQTTKGTPQDVDGQWSNILRVGMRIMYRIIDRALEKHRHVRVINEIGNHDSHSAIMLAIALDAYYRNEPRVSIDLSPATYHWYRFGKSLIGTTHGNKIKMADLGEIMSIDRKDDWSDTDYRYWYLGHVHHLQTKELRGCIVETFRTLAPKDAWHHGAGYRSDQDMRVDTIHKKWGRCGNSVIGIRQILAGLKT